MPLKKNSYLFYNFARKSCSTGRNYSSRIYNCSNTEMSTITNNHSKFSSSRIYKFFLYKNTNIFFIMSKVCYHRISTNINKISYNRISDITQVWNRRMIANIRTLTFYREANFRAFTNTCISSNIGIWTNNRSFSKIYISLNRSSRFNNNPLFKINTSIYEHTWFYNCSFIKGF